MVELDISLLGSFQVLWLGEPVTQFRSNKVRALLAYLSVEHNQPHQREKLAGLLWPEQTEGAARTNLRHSLSNLRTAIQDREGEPLLQITPQTIGFTPDSRVCIDLVRFLDITDPQEDLDFQQELNYLEKAKELYRGDFLDGFSLPDCLAFEEWLTLERERLQILYLDVLKRLGHIYQQQGEIDLAISCAREQLALNPYHEKAHRQVMRLLWLSGRIGEAAAQYQVCRQILQDEVGVDPSEITKQLYQTIREGSLPSFDQVADSEFIYQVSPPNFLAESRSAKQPLYIRPDPIFTRLEGYLAQAIGGQFQFAFVSGEAGSGKTTLLNQFISQAVENNPELIIAKGSCSSISDVDAPYAPFRRAFNQMSGEIEPYWKSGLVSTSYVRQLWNAMVFVARCLIEYGPDLFGSLIHRKKFYQRLKSALGNEDIPILRFLRSTLSASPSEEGKQQSFLFEQAGNVLEAISSRYPLILILDDIQWIDLSSSSLLFHLGKRLKNSPILLVCAYRPAEIPHEYQGESHPIQKIFTEFKRRFGNVWIDLDDYNRSNGLAFTHSYIDTEPNRLDDTFRESLFRLTSGNPLFTIELLRTMQVRGELRLDDEGVWMAEPILSWDQMPARVEGAIEERVNRLPPDLQEILSIASIEGDVFTPEVIWQICSGLSPEAQKNFIDELVKKHQLFRYHDTIIIEP
jgi:DNA-binding SARP family transcriptional activator